jgi:Tol biopolymer transport system component
MIAFIGAQQGTGWQIYTMADDGRQVRRLTGFAHGAFLANLIWSPDGRSLAYTFKEQLQSPYMQVCTFDIDSQKIRQLTLATRFNYALQWLADERIVYKETVYPETIQARPSADTYLCIIQADGTNEQHIFDHNQYNILTFSADGTKLALVPAADRRLAIARPDGSNPYPIDSDGLVVQRVAWSPDGRTLAFTGIRAHSRAMIYEDLFVYGETGRQSQRLGRILAGSSVSFSPDGRQLVASGYHNHEFTIDIFDTQTLESRKVATVKEDPRSQDLPGACIWSPDGQYLFFPTFVYPYMHLMRAYLANGQIEAISGAEAGFRSIMGLASVQA